MTASTHYPATYRAPVIRRLISVFYVVIALLLGFFGRAQLDRSSSRIAWTIAITALFLAMIFKYNESSSVIVLYADRIEKKSWFSEKVWQRHEVASLLLGSFGKYRLVRKYNKADYFSIPAGIKRDATWNDWLSHVPEVGTYSVSAGERKGAAAVVHVGFGILTLLMASLSWLNFRDYSTLENGITVNGKILTVKNFKSTASGWVDYSLPNGIACHDWMELGPNGTVQPGDNLIIAVNRACGHPVSNKNPLHPWYYLSMTFGILLMGIYQLRKLNKDGLRQKNNS